MVKEHPLESSIRAVFGAQSDAIADVVARAKERFGKRNVIIWEGDPTTFEFSYVSPAAEAVLGFPVARWTSEKTFWADSVVHPDDRDDAIAYCALATAKAKDHTFEYRARTSDGRVVHLVDFVRVHIGSRGVPAKLRGIMLEMPDHAADTPRFQHPSPTELDASA